MAYEGEITLRLNFLNENPPPSHLYLHYHLSVSVAKCTRIVARSLFCFCFFRLSNIEMIYAGSVLGCRWWMGACTNANTFVFRSNSQCLTSRCNYTLTSYIINKCTNKSSGRNMKRSVAMAPDKKCLHFSDRIIEFK